MLDGGGELRSNSGECPGLRPGSRPPREKERPSGGLYFEGNAEVGVVVSSLFRLPGRMTSVWKRKITKPKRN